MQCPQCGQTMPEASLTLRCQCGYDLRDGPTLMPELEMPKWTWALLVAAFLALLIARPDKTIATAISTFVRVGFLAVIVWAISKLRKRKSR